MSRSCKPSLFIRTLRLVGFTIALVSAQVSGVRANCGDKDAVRCYPDLDVIKGVVWSGDGFTAVGQPKLPNSSYGLVLLHLTRGGQLKDALLQVPLPSNVVSGDKPIKGESRKIVAVPDGGVAILGELILDDDHQVPWAVRLAPNGAVIWNRAFPAEPGVTTIFHSGIYDQANDRLVVVGRRTSGNDEGKCTNWSQSLVLSLKMSNGQPEIQPLYSGTPSAGLRNRQALLDIASTDRPNNYVVVGFASAPHSKTGDCQDDINIQALAVSPQGGWTLSALGKIGVPDANEMAYAVKLVRPGSYLIAGYGKDPAKGVPASQAFLVNVTPRFSVVDPSISAPFPPDGSDKDGGDRFRAIASSADKQHFTLVGSGSIGKKGVNQGIWVTVQGNLKQPWLLRQFKNQNGSEIWDAAVSDAGKVLAVGKWTDDDRQAYGWSGYLDDLSGGPISASRIPSVGPDRALPAVESLSLSGDAYQIPSAASQSGAGYFGGTLQSGAQVNLAFNLVAQKTIKISVRPETGNLGMALLDRDRRPVAFSSFGGTATELVIATLPPGDYAISIFANAAVKSYEVRLDPFAERDAFLSLQGLKDEERQDLSRRLISSGYSSSPETDIALGSETLRSISAIRQSAGDSRPISVTTLAPIVQPLAQSR
ncbi:hypothetical protein ACVIVD_008391 [Bradyrhizobium liaoningense]